MSRKPEWETRVVKQERREQKWGSIYLTSGQSRVSCCMTAQSRGTISQGLCELLCLRTVCEWWVGEGEKILFSVSFYWSKFCSSALYLPHIFRLGKYGSCVGHKTDLSSPRERISRARGEKWNNQAWSKCSPVCSRDIGFTGTRTGVEGVAKNLLRDNETEKVDMVQKTCLIE